MSVRRKLARLAAETAPVAQPAVEVAVEPEPAPAPAASSSVTDARMARIEALRAQLEAVQRRTARKERPVVARRATLLETDRTLRLDYEDTPHGRLAHRTVTLEPHARHGTVGLAGALGVPGEVLAALGKDPSLRSVRPERVLYVDTETTSLSTSAGALAFLVGLAWYRDGALVLEQLFVHEPGAELPVLARVAQRLAEADAVVSFNGKAFDLPLLRTRFVMNRVAIPAERAHLDLLHAARRIYKERVGACKLTRLEDEVLGFRREDDVPGAEIPARYVHYVRTGDARGLHAVLEHNAWDVLAMVALVAELGQRAAGAQSEGRFEAADQAALARHMSSAGHKETAVALARRALAESAQGKDAPVAQQAGLLLARMQKKRLAARDTERALREALALTPDDERLHLAMAVLLEHALRDPERALVHARKVRSLEDEAARCKRVARLEERVRRMPLRLPGIE